MSEPADVIDASLESLVADVADEFTERLSRGERPDIEAIARRYPEHATVLRQILVSLQMVRLSSGSGSRATTEDAVEMTGALGDYRLVREIGRGGMGVVYEAEQISLGRRVALKVLPFAAALDTKQLQRFKNEAQAAAHLQHRNIVPVYAVGCERGVHYYAMQFIDGQTLAQVIADLKLQIVDLKKASVSPSGTRSHGPTAEQSKDPHATEPAAPSAIPPTSPVAAISTEKSTRNPAYFHSVARLGIQAAQALEHAHQVGVIHRDIKPANLLVEQAPADEVEQGVRLWITDFGLAQVRTDARLTLTGDLMGTLRYMSPEQALANRVLVDHRTDLYSLGATLYELLTLEPVFAGNDRQELLRQIAFEEPQPLRRINGAVPAELETIILKALAKNPDERYASAQEMADDLLRYLKDEPIRARRPNVLQRARKWARRHRSIVASALVATATVLLLGLTAVAISYAQISEALTDKTEALREKSKALDERTTALGEKVRALGEKDEALVKLGAQQKKAVEALENETKAKNQLQQALTWHSVSLAERELQLNNVAKADAILEACPAETRFWEWQYLKRQCHRELKLLDAGNSFGEVAYSPDGRWLAAGGNEVTVWDAATGVVQHQFRTVPPLQAKHISFTPDGQRLAALSSLKNSILVFDLKTGKVALTLPLPPNGLGAASNVRCSPDGRHLAAGCADGTVRIWDLNGQEVHKLQGPGAAVGVAYSGDGKLLATVDFLTKNIKVWDPATGVALLTRKLPLRSIVTMDFSPDGKQIAFLSRDGLIRLVNARTGDEILTCGGGDDLGPLPLIRSGLAFSPDGTKIAVANLNARIAVLWDARNGIRLNTLRGHTDAVFGVAFSPDGKRLATLGKDRKVRLWDAAAHPDAHVLRMQPTFGISLFAVSGNGARLAFIQTRPLAKKRAGELLLLDSGGKPALTIDLMDDGIPTALTLSHDSHLVAMANPKGAARALKLLDAGTGKELPREFDKVVSPITHLTFSPDGQYLAGASGSFAMVWVVKTGKMFCPPITHLQEVKDVKFSPDGMWLASGSLAGTVKIIHLARLETLHTLQANKGGILGLAFRPDGRHLVSVGAEGHVTIWETGSGKCLHTLVGHRGPVGSAAYSPDGGRLVTGGFDNTIKLWDPETERELLTRRASSGGILTLAFSPDGYRLVARHSNAIHFYEATPWGQPLAPLPRLE
jgi:WD40 repeat protein/serine/threonine protein kinase